MSKGYKKLLELYEKYKETQEDIYYQLHITELEWITLPREIAYWKYFHHRPLIGVDRYGERYVPILITNKNILA